MIVVGYSMAATAGRVGVAVAIVVVPIGTVLGRIALEQELRRRDLPA
jgi:hypothetical protein